MEGTVEEAVGVPARTTPTTDFLVRPDSRLPGDLESADELDSERLRVFAVGEEPRPSRELCREPPSTGLPPSPRTLARPRSLPGPIDRRSWCCEGDLAEESRDPSVLLLLLAGLVARPPGDGFVARATSPMPLPPPGAATMASAVVADGAGGRPRLLAAACCSWYCVSTRCPSMTFSEPTAREADLMSIKATTHDGLSAPSRGAKCTY